MPNLQPDDGELAHQILQTLRWPKKHKQWQETSVRILSQQLKGSGRQQMYQPVQASVHIVGLYGLFGEK